MIREMSNKKVPVGCLKKYLHNECSVLANCHVKLRDCDLTACSHYAANPVQPATDSCVANH